MAASVEELGDPRFAPELFTGGAESQRNLKAIQALQLRSAVESMRATNATVELGKQANRYANRASWLVAVIAGSAFFNAYLAGRAAGLW